MGKAPIDTSGWIGRRFDSLVVAEVGHRTEDRPACLCYCDCDEEHKRPILVRATNLLSGRVKSCGCGRNAPRPYTGSVKVGDVSGRLTVISVPTSTDDRDADGDYVCHCKCSCGHNDDYVCKCTDIQTKNVKSCGCIDRERLKPINIGDVFGKLTVIEEVSRDPVTNRRRYLCKCSCPAGNTRIVAADKLTGGETKSCGCLVTQLRDEYSGRIKVGYETEGLIVTDIPTEHKSGRSRDVICTCKHCSRKGVRVNSSNLLSGATDSCGCRRKTRMTVEDYALTETFKGMKQRCYNPNYPEFKYWGGKGVTVCDEWLNDKRKFIDWAISNGYHKGLSIDRIDNNGPYAPWNCRIADMKTQQNNRTNNVNITVDGETKNLSQWAECIGVSINTLSHVLKRKTKEEGDKYIRDKLTKKKENSQSERKANLERILWRDS